MTTWRREILVIEVTAFFKKKNVQTWSELPDRKEVGAEQDAEHKALTASAHSSRKSSEATEISTASGAKWKPSADKSDSIRPTCDSSNATERPPKHVARLTTSSSAANEDTTTTTATPTTDASPVPSGRRTARRHRSHD